MPGARCARGLVCKMDKKDAHEHTGHTGITRTFPAQWVTAYLELSPVTGLSCHRHWRSIASANLTPASGSQDHTISPSASGALVFSALRVHRSPPRERDDRDSPLCGTGWWKI